MIKTSRQLKDLIRNRATMDIDTTIRNFPLDCEHAKQIVEEIAAIPIDDNDNIISTYFRRNRSKRCYAGVLGKVSKEKQLCGGYCMGNGDERYPRFMR